MTLIPDLAAVRARFASLPRLAYFSSGSYGLLSDSVRASFETYLTDRVENGAYWGGWVDRLEQVRSQVASLFGVDTDEIAITASASAGLNAIASAFDFAGPRNKVVASNFEFPTSGQIWHAQSPVGAQVVHIAEKEDGTIPLQPFLDAIDDRTAVVALSHVCYRHGGKIPDYDIRAIAAAAHRHGAIVILDCYQVAGSERIDPRALDVDVCVGGMLKYLLGTGGIGYLYVRRELVDRLTPRASGWFAQADPNAMDIFANVPSPSARRFEAGTPPVPNLYAAGAGLDLILGIGLDAIGAHVRTITRLAIDRFAAEGISLATPLDDARRGPLLAIRSKDEVALVERLAEQQVMTSSRDGKVRAGFHFYNDEADVERLVRALTDNRALLA
ncbi:putative aminotransferase YcbU [Sphingomonas sp. DBB INV C78]|uniref:aminotransferase class V-fold PLP-dependent enzyme n=1 Tax=Sphingomonas sp. DBB INV C78 TaxID=3349434 RepID=UPI0036D21E4B